MPRQDRRLNKLARLQAQHDRLDEQHSKLIYKTHHPLTRAQGDKLDERINKLDDKITALEKKMETTTDTVLRDFIADLQNTVEQSVVDVDDLLCKIANC